MTSTVPSKDESRFHAWAILTLVLVGWFIYAFSLPNAMFWDDDDFILKNQFIKSWKYWPNFFTENLIAGSSLLSNYWRPLLLTVFAAQWSLWKDWAPGYHAVNTCFHLADTILLYCLLNIFFRNRRLSIVTSFLFLIHPVQTEAVVYVNSLGDSLSTFFVFGALILYTRFRQHSWPATAYAAALLCYVLGLLSKETAFILPGLIIAVEWFVLNPQLPLANKLRHMAIWLSPFIFLAMGYAGLRATVLNFNNTFNFYKESNLYTSNISVRLLTFFHTLQIYAGLLITPFDLRVERNLPWATTLFSLPVLTGTSIFLTSLWALIKKSKSLPLIGFGILWFSAAIFPMSNLLIPINAVIYEHWLYVPMIGPTLILAHYGLKVFDQKRWQTLLLCVAIPWTTTLVGLSIKRILEWRDPVTFYEQTLHHAPNSYRVINNLGMAYADKARLDKAQEAYERAIALDPTNPVAYHNLGNLLAEQKQFELAKKNYAEALQQDPKFLFTYPNLANLYLRERDFPRARAVLEQFVDHSFNKLPLLDTLLRIAMEERNYPAALRYLEAAEKIDPVNPAIKQSIAQLHKALKISTHSPSTP